MERKTFAEKDKMIAKATKEVNKGITRCETTKGKTKSYGYVQTEYGCKPEPHK